VLTNFPLTVYPNPGPVPMASDDPIAGGLILPVKTRWRNHVRRCFLVFFVPPVQSSEWPPPAPPAGQKFPLFVFRGLRQGVPPPEFDESGCFADCCASPGCSLQKRALRLFPVNGEWREFHKKYFATILITDTQFFEVSKRGPNVFHSPNAQ